MSLSSRLMDLATRVATEHKSLRTLINGNVADLAGLTTAQKSSLVAAINEVAAAVADASAIDDSGTSATSSWSSSKTRTEIDSSVAAIVDGAPGTLDTLNELAAALGDNANIGAELAAAVAARVRFDAAQSLTAPQQAQARTNIGAVATADVGNTDADFVATFEAGLA